VGFGGNFDLSTYFHTNKTLNRHALIESTEKTISIPFDSIDRVVNSTLTDKILKEYANRKIILFQFTMERILKYAALNNGRANAHSTEQQTLFWVR
jgi:hypothetical protein